MRKISVAITAAALAVSMLAAAFPAAAVTGYDSAYAGESAFVNLNPGQSNEFQVFFANTGTTTWTRGTGTQVDLAACLADKTTCNAQDASEAPWNSGWLSATRYATTTQTAVSPGSIATFKYTVQAPAGVAAGTYRFNGDLVLAASGERIHPEGYFQDATVGGTGGATATLVAINPVTGDVAGGTTVTASGTNFACTPAFPSVDFGGTLGTVTSCGSTALTVTAPAHAAGTVNVTVTNAGAGASNALLFTFKDLTKPSLTQLSAIGGTSVVNVAWNESVCNNVALALVGDFTFTVNGSTPISPTAIRTTSGGDPTAGGRCDAAAGAAAGSAAAPFTSLDFDIGTTLVPGDFVTATITAAGAAKIQDTSGNIMSGAQTVTGTAQGDTTKPTISSAALVSGSTTQIRVNYSEPVICGTSNGSGALSDFLNQFTATVGGSTFTPTSASCPTSATLGANRITLTFGSNVSGGGFITYQESSTAANRVKDLSGNNATSPQTASVAAAPTAVPPTITDAHVTANLVSTNFNDTGDAFSLTFNEAMDTGTAGDQIAVTDSDPQTAKDTFTFICGTNVTCSWNSAGTTLTVTVITGFSVGGGTTTAGLQLPLTINALTGFADSNDGVAPNLSASDKTID